MIVDITTTGATTLRDNGLKILDDGADPEKPGDSLPPRSPPIGMPDARKACETLLAGLNEGPLFAALTAELP